MAVITFANTKGGAGKTTAMRMLIGLLAPSGGTAPPRLFTAARSWPTSRSPTPTSATTAMTKAGKGQLRPTVLSDGSNSATNNGRGVVSGTNAALP